MTTAMDPLGSTRSGIPWNEYEAGLSGVDKVHVNRVVAEISKGSRFYNS